MLPLLCGASLVSLVRAADGTWALPSIGPASGSGSWGATGSWVGGVIADGAGFTADFGTVNPTGTGTNSNVVTLDGNRTVGNLIFGDTDTSTATAWTINVGTSGTLTLAGTTPTITVNSLGTNGYARFNAVIAGTDGLVKNGSGLLILAGNNTYTGTTTVNGGILRIGADAFTGSVSGDIINNAVVQFQRGNANTIAGNISGTGSVTVLNGSNQLTLSGNNTYQGGTTLTAGAILVGSDTAIGTGTLTMNLSTRLSTAGGVARTLGNLVNVSGIGNTQNVSFGGVQDNLTNVGDLTFTNTGSSLAPSGTGTITVTNSTTVTFAQQFTGSGRVITKLGTGTLVLNGDNTYTGATTVNAGTLRVNGAVAGVVNVNSTGTFGGSGTVAGAATAAAGSFLSAGAGAGAVGSLTFNSTLDISGLASGTGGLLFDLGAVGASDQIVSGALSIGTGLLDLDDFSFTTLGGFGVGVYTLFDAASITGSLGSNLFGTVGGLDAALSISGNSLVLTVIPEPSALAVFAGVGALGFACLRRRRRA